MEEDSFVHKSNFSKKEQSEDIKIFSSSSSLSGLPDLPKITQHSIPLIA